MGLAFTPLRVAVVTGIVVAGTIGAPHLSYVKEQVKEDIASTVDRLDGPPASADSPTVPLYRYKDARGRSHYVTSLDKVPEKYQKSVEKDLRLPKIMYSDMPVVEVKPDSEDPHRSDTEPHFAPPHKGGSNGNGPITLSGDGGDDSELRTAGSPEGRGGGLCEGGGHRRGPMATILKWLCFSRDTFNRMSGFMSGR